MPDHTVETTALFDIDVSGAEMTLTTYDGVIVRYNGVYNVYVTIPWKYLLVNLGIFELCGKYQIFFHIILLAVHYQ